MRQRAFNDVAIARSIRAGDSNRFKLDLRKQRSDLIEEAKTLSIVGPDLTVHNEFDIRNHSYISYSDYPTTLVLRALANYIGRKCGIDMPSRDNLVRGVIQSLSDATPFSVIRRDIESFYEHLPVAPIRENLLNTAILAPSARKILAAFIERFCGNQTHGLPRGVGLTAVLAEFVMRQFDQEVIATPGVYRYFRFADDILIFSTLPPQAVSAALDAALPPGMKFNAKKGQVISCASTAKEQNDRQLTYLGYSFETKDGKVSSRYRPVTVSIDARKLTKMKTRTIVSLKAFLKDRDIALLERRLRFLTGNYKIKRKGAFRTESDFIRSGIFYNYHLCGTYKLSKAEDYDGKGLKELDGLYHSLLVSASSEFSAPLSAHPAALSRLRSLSFYQSYAHRLMNRFTPTQIREIKRAWRHV